MKIAVVGGGIFGVSAAWILARGGYEVDLYERNSDILSAASGINQFRIHRGYHYPRSRETMLSARKGEKSFLREYSEAVIRDDVEHYYCVSSQDSISTAQQCEAAWKSCNLSYKRVNLEIVNKDKVSLSVRVEEYLLDPVMLRQVCGRKLDEYGVNVLLGKEAREEELKFYDFVVISAYANNNSLLKGLPGKQKDYQFELCEKPVLELPSAFHNKSVVILDGPFMCIDPFGQSGLFVMGNVVHAIHARNVGKFPHIPKDFTPLLDRGVVKNPSVTNIGKFIKSAAQFFPDAAAAKHVGSMFTVRTVLPDREHDDARPTVIDRAGERRITLLSGKITTCIDAAEKVVDIIKKSKK